MTTSKVIAQHKFEIPQRGTMIINELADGTYHGSGTTHIYTKEQFEAAKEKLIAMGAKEV